MGNLFRQKFAQLRKETSRALQKKVEHDRVRWPPATVVAGIVTDRSCCVQPWSVLQLINADVITRGLQSALATGNWGTPKRGQAHSKTGVSQVLQRHVFSSTLSHLRRTNTPIGREGKVLSGRTQPRRGTRGPRSRRAVMRCSSPRRVSCITRTGAWCAPRRRLKAAPVVR
jgi:DNA-directed RNA polymerase beta subunit